MLPSNKSAWAQTQSELATAWAHLRRSGPASADSLVSRALPVFYRLAFLCIALIERAQRGRHGRRNLCTIVVALAFFVILGTQTSFRARKAAAVLTGASSTSHFVARQQPRTDTHSSLVPWRSRPRVHVAYVMQRPTGVLYDFDVSHVLTLLNITLSSLPTASDRYSFVTHVLSTDAEVIGVTRTRFPDVQTHHLQPTGMSARANRFLKAYLHQSVNPIEMERFCLLRWIVLADFFTGLAEESAEDPHEYDYILAVDSDVAMFMTPQVMIQALGFREWVTFESHEVVAGAMILWKRHGLESFANHIVDFYARGDKEVAENVRQHGVLSSNGCRREWSTVLPCSNATHMWHMSDVYVWRAWAAQNPHSRTIQISSDFEKSGQTCDYIEQPLCADKVLFKRGSGSSRRVVALRYDSALPALNAGREAHDPTNARRDLCFIHFQGSIGKHLIPEFYAFLSSSGNASGYAFTKTLCLY